MDRLVWYGMVWCLECFKDPGLTLSGGLLPQLDFCAQCGVTMVRQIDVQVRIRVENPILVSHIDHYQSHRPVGTEN